MYNILGSCLFNAPHSGQLGGPNAEESTSTCDPATIQHCGWSVLQDDKTPGSIMQWCRIHELWNGSIPIETVTLVIIYLVSLFSYSNFIWMINWSIRGFPLHGLQFVHMCDENALFSHHQTNQPTRPWSTKMQCSTRRKGVLRSPWFFADIVQQSHHDLQNSGLVRTHNMTVKPQKKKSNEAMKHQNKNKFRLYPADIFSCPWAKDLVTFYSCRNQGSAASSISVSRSCS